MSTESFRALVLKDKSAAAEFQDVTHDALPQGDVLVRVQYSSLNYKDALAVLGAGKVVRSFPMVPGIDFVGTVEQSDSDAFKPGDAVILTGWGVGESHWGGYARYARVKSEWLLPLPDGMKPEHAMAFGTAGLTAMLAIRTLEVQGGLTPEQGEVVVTGASGGAGGVAVAILGECGFNVVASTGRTESADYLKSLGANEVIGRFDAPERPMQSGRWAGAVDAVGGDTLAHLISTMQYGGCIAAYGLAGSAELNTTVLPFILRGVTLFGIDSVMCPTDQRQGAWQRLALDIPAEKTERMMRVEPLSNIVSLCDDILAGKVRGRVVIDVNQ